MKTRVKMLVMAVFCGGMLFSAASQVVVDAYNIRFRDQTKYGVVTEHYGDLHTYGGNGGSKWGWLICNKLRVETNNTYASEIDANLILYKNLSVLGSKNFIHPHPTDDAKVIRYVSAESGEALTLARGSAKTVNGEVTLKLPDHFSLVTSKNEPITVIVTPKGAPVLLYTKKESKEEIVVAMKKSDFAEFRDVEFAYQVTGVRDGFEIQENIVDLEKLNVTETEDELEKNEVKKRIRAIAQRMEQRAEKKETAVKEENK